MSYIPSTSLFTDEVSYVPMPAITGLLGGTNIVQPIIEAPSYIEPVITSPSGKFLPSVADVIASGCHPISYWMIQLQA